MTSRPTYLAPKLVNLCGSQSTTTYFSAFLLSTGVILHGPSIVCHATSIDSSEISSNRDPITKIEGREVGNTIPLLWSCHRSEEIIGDDLFGLRFCLHTMITRASTSSLHIGLSSRFSCQRIHVWSDSCGEVSTYKNASKHFGATASEHVDASSYIDFPSSFLHRSN